MTWARIDDQMQHHPKIQAAGAIAELIQYRAIQYCCRYLTDGFLPANAVSSLLTGLEHVSLAEGGVPGMFEVGRDCDEIDWPEVMVDAGLWHRRKGGYLVHDFLDYNPKKTDVISVRDARRRAGASGAKVTNSRRWPSASDATHADTSADAVPTDPSSAKRRPLPLPLETKTKAPGTTPGVTTPPRARATRGKPGVLAGSGEQPSRRQPASSRPTRISKTLNGGQPTEQHASRPPPGLYAEIHARIQAQHPEWSKEEQERATAAEYTQAIQHHA